MALLIGKRLLNNRLFLQTQRRHGYIVLLPEIGEEAPGKNPLLQDDGLPQFNNVTIENCMTAIGKQTYQFESDVKNIGEKISTLSDVDMFKEVICPLEKLGTSLDLTWGLSKTLYMGNNSMMPTKYYIAMHERAKSVRATKYNNPAIFKAAQVELKKEDLSTEKKRVLQKYVLEGKLNGLHLDEEKKALLNMSMNKLAKEQGGFKIKTDYVTKMFSHKIQEPDHVRDFPDDLLKSMALSSRPLEGPWLVTLQPHIALPFMEYCPNREFRWNVWNAINTRGSGYGSKEYGTSGHIEEIRFIRRDQAKILGYENYAEVSMETKMAGSVDKVKEMLQALLKRARPAQEKELESLYAFALERGFEGSRIELWDVAYWERKQCKTLYDYDEKQIQQYFPLPHVLEGLFELCENLFDIKIKQRCNVPTWNKDVKYYDVFEPHSSAPIAGFYFDPYERTDEKMLPRMNNGQMVSIQNQSKIAESKPLAALIFNFTPPTSELPSLLSFKDVQVLFHRFGQTLQHSLTRTTYSEVSGLSNIEWDAVDVAGNVLSHWLFNKVTIDKISCHHLSEDKLPQHMFDSIISHHKHGAGTKLCKELYLAALDLEIYTSKDFWLDIVKGLWPKYRHFPLAKVDSHTCSFTQIFIEEWAAAYYTHTWSKMIAADVYSAFHEVREDENQVLDVAKRFKSTFLTLGGSCNSNQVFRNFRGRDPSPNALLASLGLKENRK